jgi:SAM-dependent methyltransferase
VSNDFHKYDNEVQPDNKFGHTLDLLQRHLPPPGEDAVHLDLACGFGHIAEPIVDLFGLHYVGVDIDDGELDVLRERGLEAHALDLTDPEVGDHLRKVLDGRRLASVTFLDGLEHLVDGSHVLAALGDLLAEHRAVAVTSVPNATHLDVGITTLLGRWDYTEAGLLDITHYQLYSHDSLRRSLRRAGLNVLDTHDVLMVRSDQHFPTDHVGLAETSAFSSYLRSVRSRAEPHGYVNQFVWALTAAPPVPGPAYVEPQERSGDVFLSIIMRTQGRRPQELREALLCLAAQSVQDFEVLIVGHRTEVAEQKSVEAIIAEQPPYLRERIRFERLDRGRRSAPINRGIELATGRYVAIFDDDDVVMGDWVKEFADAEREHGGRLLRCVALRQDVAIDTVLGLPAVRSTSAPKALYNATFSLTEHLVTNQSPPIGWVFPRSLVTDFGLHYDDSMTTTEDWEFLLQAAELAGVTDIDRGTAIYRWWDKRESSRTAHPPGEWAQNQREIERRIDSRPFLLPAGETRTLRRELSELRTLRKRVELQAGKIQRLEARKASQAKRIAQLQRRVGRPDGAPQAPEHVSLRSRLRPRTRARALLARVRRG